MPRWLKTVLLAAGLVIVAAFLAEPVLLVGKRRRRTAARAATPPGHAVEPVLVLPPRNGQGPGSGPLPPRDGQGPASGPPPSGKTRVVLADYDRVVVTYSKSDDTVYVLRPPGGDPKAILRAARLVLPEDPYGKVAEQLGMPPSWPIVLADFDRIVVTHSKSDDTVYVLRPPGGDPKAILRAARLVLPEDPYEELAEQLGVPAGLPMG